MAFFNRDKRAPARKRRPRIHEASKCRFCRDKTEEIDYKDLAVLQKLVTNQGKHFTRKRSGNCAKHQRASRRALKHARYIGLMPFCG
ncbi:MAG: 30S ribosomal protein S18 [Phycisphaerae bacterium]|nr:30S ribosomal protein S18 [Phycisphaerae bacterium]